MRLYCDAVGIDYQDSMINWKPLTPEQFAEFKEWQEWCKTAIESTGIRKRTPSNLPDIHELPPDIQQCFKDNMPYYEKLYAMRLKK